MEDRRYLAEVTDPTTGAVTVLGADSEAELDRLVEAHLQQAFPLELPAQT